VILTRRSSPWTAAAVAAGFLAAAAFAAHAALSNGALGFPLDDAWIHLNYARTLREHGTFAYFAGGPPTAGSTAPLFTLLEAAGFMITSHEKPLALLLGLAGQLAFLVAFARWSARRLGDARWAALAVALVGLDGRAALLAVSGMETSLFLALCSLAIERRLAGRPLAAGLALGAALWVRPDALILAVVLAVDALLEARASRAGPGAGAHRVAGAAAAPTAGPGRGPALLFSSFAALALGYAVFHMLIGGRPLPATFAAKTAFYAGRSRIEFLMGDVAECFGSGAWLVLAPFALGSLARVIVALARGRGSSLRLEAGWALALPLAYLVLLPYSHRFTRYLVPALPSFAILAVAGVRDAERSAWLARAVGASARRVALGALLVGAGLLHGLLLARSDEFYRFACRYHAERHERAGRWLAEHTPSDAVIGTHDVGAIAFYSRRRIVDAAGLVSREVTPWIGKPTYTDSLAALFDRSGVTHLAGFDDWLPVDDVMPLVVFNTEPEVMRVFPWIPGRTHLVPRDAAALADHAESALAAGDVSRSLGFLRAALERDRASARVWLLLGDALAREGRAEPARQAWVRARALMPESPDVARRLGLAADTLAGPRRGP